MIDDLFDNTKEDNAMDAFGTAGEAAIAKTIRPGDRTKVVKSARDYAEALTKFADGIEKGNLSDLFSGGMSIMVAEMEFAAHLERITRK
jgi:hypothetical protein